MQRHISRSGAATAIVNAEFRQPNEIDWRRIQRSLKTRARYRYVAPVVEQELGGYRIVSPCCSRNIEPGGGRIDIARLAYDQEQDTWRIYSKNHTTHEWEPQSQGRLHELLSLLNHDPKRVFWQ